MGMCVQKVIKISIFLAFLAIFCGCEDMDNILSSAGTYKINARVSDIPLDECSFAVASDEIRPFFEEPVSDDPDITALVVFLRDTNGDIKGWKVVYSLEAEQKPAVNSSQSKKDNAQEGEDSDDTVKKDKTPNYVNGEEKIIAVENLDGDLPFLPLPNNLPMGQYTIVYQVMSGKNILQKTEKNIFYLGENFFSFDAINTYLPGIADSAQLVPKETVIMLEAGMVFNSRLDPYIVWYEGKNKIGEGKFSEGAGYLFWKAPEQSGFFSLSAEIFPVNDYEDLIGYKKEISLLISSKTIDVNLVSNNIEQLIHWYTLEGNLNDAKMTASAERALKPAAKNIPKWMGVDGTYGIATGCDNILMLPKVLISNNEQKTWQILFRMKALNDGEIFSVRFGISQDVSMRLFMEGKNLVLTLASPLETVSQIIDMPETYVESGRQAFFTAGVSFSISSGLLSAQLNIMEETINSELTEWPISLKTEIENEFKILLGFDGSLRSSVSNNAPPDEETETVVEPEFNVLWDEFALYNMPPMDILAADIKPLISEDQTETAAISMN